MAALSGEPRLPRIWAVAQRDLRKLIQEVAASHAHEADIRLMEKPLEEVVATARELVARGEADAFLCTGAIAEAMRASLRVPVQRIKVTGFDLLRAITDGAAFADKLMIISHRSVDADLDALGNLFTVELHRRAYEDYDAARAHVAEAKALGFTTIIGPSIVIQAAESLGLRGVLLHSEQSVREAVREAVIAARLRRDELARGDRVDSILRHLREGVMAVNEDQAIDFINPAMAALLNVNQEWAVGKPLAAVCSEITVEDILRTKSPDLERVRVLAKKMVLLSRIPIAGNDGKVTVIVTYQEATDIQRADRSIRSSMKPRSLRTRYRLEQVIGESPAIHRTVALARQYAESDSTVLISGESGTGKELFAQGIHGASKRRGKAFVAINCAALPESLLESELFGYEEGAFTGSRRGGKAGLIELAHQGTLFLDEIGDMPVSLQTRLLRVLQEREVLRLGGSDAIPVDIRVIAATHRDLRQMMGAGEFRADLYYRVNILHLDVPPLRKRGRDAELLTRHFLGLRTAQAQNKPDETTLAELLPLFSRYAWPGNIRELENIVERFHFLILDRERAKSLRAGLREIAPELFGATREAGVPAKAKNEPWSAVREKERELLRATLREHGGDRKLAAEALGMSRTTLWRRLKSLEKSGTA